MPRESADLSTYSALAARTPTEPEHGAVNGSEPRALPGIFAAEVLESTTDGVFMLDRNWCFAYLNSRAADLISSGKDLIGHNVWEQFPAARHLPFWDNYHAVMDDRIATQFVAYYPAPLDRWFEVHAYPTDRGMSVYFRDVSNRREEEERLRLFEQAVHAAPIGISISRAATSRDLPLIYVNPAFEKMTGYTAEEVLGRDCRFLQGTDLAQKGREEFQKSIKLGRPAKVLLRNYRKDGQKFINDVNLSPVSDESGTITHILGIQNDVTDQLEIKAKLAKQAQYDSLTGLANRYLLLERLNSSLEKAALERSQIAVVIVDLDNFKHLNDRLGHMQTDVLLVQISRRLNALVEATDTVARLGGDEFALILKNWSDLGRLQKLIDKLLVEIRKPILSGEQELLVTGSAGVALFPQDGSNSEELLQMADLSMYWIKKCGKNSVRFYSSELRFNRNEPLDVAIGFRHALQNREFCLYYQPRVSSDNLRITGFEALIRWQHPERGLLLPAQFIRIAEDTGLINEIGRWVLEEALEQNAAWRKLGLEPVTIAVNVSPAQIRDPEFPNIVAAALAKTGVPAASLELELTESLLIDNADLADASLRALKKLGVRIAIDDFGAGYSGLHYLSRFPVDTIKIDLFFTRNIVTNKTAATICRSIIALGEALGLTTVGEGVEEESQASLLRSWQCSELQGYMFAKPLPAQAAEDMLRSPGKPWSPS